MYIFAKNKYNHMIMNTFNVEIKAARQRAELTQRALAEACECSLSAIQKLERAGTDRVPQRRLMRALENALGINIVVSVAIQYR